MNTWVGGLQPLFVVSGTQVVERRVPAPPIVPALSMYAASAAVVSACVAHRASCTSSVLCVAQKLSTTALSQQSPRRLMLTVCSAAARAAWQSSPVWYVPRLE